MRSRNRAFDDDVDHSLRLDIEDERLRARLGRLFACKAPSSTDARTLIDVSGCGPFEVSFAGKKLGGSWDEEEVVGLVDYRFEALHRSLLQPGECAVHACSVTKWERAVVFVGLSGTGKTTLGLALAERGWHMLGDEYGVVSSALNTYHQEPYPVSVKDEALRLFPKLANAFGIRAKSKWGVSSTLFSTTEIQHAFSSSTRASEGETLPVTTNRREISFIFPQRNAGFEQPLLKHVSITQLPQLLLPSIDNNNSRTETCSLMLSFFAARNVELYALEYCDARSAAALIESLFRPGNRDGPPEGLRA